MIRGTRARLLAVPALSLGLLSGGCMLYNPSLFGDLGEGGSGSGGRPASGGSESGGSGGTSLGGAAGTDGGAGSTGTGGVSTGGGSSGGSSGTGGASAVDMIDDFEDGDVSVIYTSEKRTGHWDVANDGTSGTQSPAAGFTNATDVSAAPPYAESVFAGYTEGSGFTSWGASLNVSMLASGAYDASAFQGVAFWAKAGVGSVKKVRVRYVSGDTDPRGGICKTSGASAELCFDHFVADVTLTNEWKYFEVPFDDFHQLNVGQQFPAINLTTAYGFEFYFGPNQTFEFWVDDFAFVK